MDPDKLAKSLHSPLQLRLQEELKRIRVAAGLNQVQAAALLGRPQSFISKCESGERRLDVPEFLVWCRKMGADPCTVIKRIEKKKAVSGSTTESG